MEKKCRNCRWYNNGQCLNLNNQINVGGSMLGAKYVEDGQFADDVKETVNYNNIIRSVLDELIENEIIKKTYANDLKKLFKAIDRDSIAENIEEELNDGLATSVMNLDDKVKGGSTIEIQNPSEFYCSRWV